MARKRTPPVVIDAEHLGRLESLATAAMDRAPDLADRLLDELARARVVQHARMPAKVVSLGSQVTYRDESTDKEHVVTLVLPDAADISRGRISVITPIGVALLGLAEGASFAWETRGGEERQLTILHVAQHAEPEGVA